MTLDREDLDDRLDRGVFVTVDSARPPTLH